MKEDVRPKTASQASSRVATPSPTTTSSIADSAHSLPPLAPPPSHSWLQNLRRPRSSQCRSNSPKLVKKTLQLSHSSEDMRRDSALLSASSTSTTASSRFAPQDGSPKRTSGTSTVPTIVVQDDAMGPGLRSDVSEIAEHRPATASEPGPELGSRQRSSSGSPSFQCITTAIPPGSFEELTSPDKIKFSQRGSMLLNGKKLSAIANGFVQTPKQSPEPSIAAALEKKREDYSKPIQYIENAQDSGPVNDPGTIPPESVPEAGGIGKSDPGREDEEQQKVEEVEQAASVQNAEAAQLGGAGSHGLLAPTAIARPRPYSTARQNIPSIASSRVLSMDEESLSRKVRAMYAHGNDEAHERPEQTLIEEDEENEINGSTLAEGSRSSRPHSDRPRGQISRQPHETAGGIEDWEDVEGGEVDRYGFIMPKKTGSRGSNRPGSAATFETPGHQGVSTALMEAPSSPRRKYTVRRRSSRARSTRSAVTDGVAKVSNGPGSIRSQRSNTSFMNSPSPLRYAANRLPHNKERRWMEEASDMLTLPPGLADLAEVDDGGKAAQAMKKKEWRREEKWRKMGKATQRSTKGGGMLFDFDPKDSKVISRTWKGIPDRWRASAWYSFLAASDKALKKGAPDDELIAAFHLLQEEGSADDPQIDTDVPRTINRHIMFRRRYRGGQRLLFRVLHAFSLYFPDTGYVQGMAALAATLLCYYDEEHAFIMMVRLWQVRGLERLYQSGFAGLMEALDEFEKKWLQHGEVAKKLEELSITATAYGTRWYLTLFNYSLPFPAQLRVWDVFMLLGDVSNALNPENSFGADLDVLHATSAALIDAMREILLDSDFENAMKVLTSWIPIKDEELLMKVAHAEWKMRKKKKG